MTYYIITIGCQMNKADSERVASFLEENKYLLVNNYLEADLLIINTCGIRQSAEDRIYGLVNQIKKRNPLVFLVVTGCLSQRLDVKKRLNNKVDLFLAINQLPDLIKLYKETKKTDKRKEDKQQIDRSRLIKGEEYLKIPAKYSSSFSAYVPIGNGCNNFCSYCVVPYARGPEVYRLVEDIFSEVKILIKKGYKEIILIAQNVNSYNSRKTNFAKLLEKIAKLPGDFWLRFSSSHPKDLSDDLINIMAKYDKICPHLHLALQSGDDQILKKMNRKYKVKDFEKIINKIRKVKKDIAISTDIIVGFPGETKKQFNNTCLIFKKLQFDMAYISQYSKRPQTVAWSFKDDVSRLEKKRREKILNNILEESIYLNNKKYLNKVVRVLVEGKNKHGQYFAKDSKFKTIFFSSLKKKDELIGNFIKIKIKKINKFSLVGEEIMKDK
jgi:tRNA-2-methylthio-N6-dimethylallyladenosine synthase